MNVKKIFMLFLTLSFLLGNNSNMLFAAKKVPVTIFNYIRAETDMQFKAYAEKYGAFGKFYHMRKPYDVNHQITVRPNQDTLYSCGIFDLTYPVVVTLPDVGNRYMSLSVINQDHYDVLVFHPPGKFYITKECVKTRYAFLLIRIFVNPKNPKDIEKVHKLQDKITVYQEKKGKLELPDWDMNGILKIRHALEIIGTTVDSSRKMFGDKYSVDPIIHLIGTAIGWGGLPDNEAIYLNFTPEKNDGKTPYILTFKPPILKTGFWSVTVYDKHGFLIKNKWNIYSYNNITAKKNKDGTVTIHFGGDPNSVNFIPIVKGWNYIVRLFRPSKDIIEEKVKFPGAVPVK